MLLCSLAIRMTCVCWSRLVLFIVLLQSPWYLLSYAKGGMSGSKRINNRMMSNSRLKPKRYEPSSPEERLLHVLLREYDTDARGVVEPTDSTLVEIQFLLLRIHALDERSQILTTTGLVITDWFDNRLKWDPKKYGNLTDIVIKPQRIWLPELALMNGADELAPDFSRIRVLLNHDGKVHWEPGGIFETTCDIDIRYFPFDEQRCPILIGAWAYYASRMNLTNSNDTIPTHDFRLNGEWQIFATKAEGKLTILPCCPDTQYPYVEFTLYLRRRYTFYVMNIILPCTLLSVLVMIVFCLPPDAGEKISLGISVLLAFTVFLLMVAENVPRTSLHIPVIVIYLTCTMALGTVSVCLTVLVLNLHHRDPERKVPQWAKVLVLNYLSKILCVRARKPQTMAESITIDHDYPGGVKDGIRRIAKDVGVLKPMLNSNHGHHTECNNDINHAKYVNINEQVFPAFKEKEEKPIKDSTSNDWREIAHVLDRLFFWTIFIFMTASGMIILCIPHYREPIIDK